MKTGLIITGAIIGAIMLVTLIVGGTVVGMYNGMVSQRLAVDNSWASVESQYQRRLDLIPNIVNATQGYLKQEQKVFGDIAQARTQYANSGTDTNSKVQATTQLDGALSRLLVVMENYPQLQSNNTVRALTDELSGTENRVNIARDRYNTEVQKYNTQISVFPRSLLAGLFNFQAKTFYKSDAAAATAPVVKLNE